MCGCECFCVSIDFMQTCKGEIYSHWFFIGDTQIQRCIGDLTTPIRVLNVKMCSAPSERRGAKPSHGTQWYSGALCLRFEPKEALAVWNDWMEWKSFITLRHFGRSAQAILSAVFFNRNFFVTELKSKNLTNTVFRNEKWRQIECADARRGEYFCNM